MTEAWPLFCDSLSVLTAMKRGSGLGLAGFLRLEPEEEDDDGDEATREAFFWALARWAR